MKSLFAISAVALMFLGAAPLAMAQMKDGEVHKAVGVVTNVDRAGGKVTLKHEPIRSLNWPTMTMVFGVKDKAMLEKVAKDKKVQFEFVQQDQQFVITSIK